MNPNARLPLAVFAHEASGLRRVCGAVVLTLGASTGCASPPPARLMTYAEYAQVRHAAPYVVHVERGAGELFYFGSRHIFDPSDVELDEIERAWSEFRPTLAFNEGGSPTPRDTREATVREAGEAGWVRFLARCDDVRVESLEPTRDAEVQALVAQGYTLEEIKLFYALRQVAHFQASAQGMTLESYLERVLADLARTPGLEGYPKSVVDLSEAGARLLGGVDTRGADWKWSLDEVPPEFFDPVARTRNAYTNKVSAALGVLRDEHMLELLNSALERGERVFAVVGASHVVMQEPALLHAAERKVAHP